MSLSFSLSSTPMCSLQDVNAMQAPRVPTHLWCCHRNRSMRNPMPFHYAFEIPLTSAVLFHLLIRAKVGTRTTIAAYVEDQFMWLCCCAMFRPSKIFWRVAVLEEEQCDVCTSSCLTQGGTGMVIVLQSTDNHFAIVCTEQRVIVHKLCPAKGANQRAVQLVHKCDHTSWRC